MSQFRSIHKIQARRIQSNGKYIREGVDGLSTRDDASESMAVYTDKLNSTGYRTSNVRSLTPPSYWIMPCISNVTMVATANSAQLTLSMNFINSTGNKYAGRNIDINYLKIMKLARILGLMAIISFMIVFLFIWLYANLKGYVYFSVGEPILFIKYQEWVLGFTGIIVAAHYLLKELNEGIIFNTQR